MKLIIYYLTLIALGCGCIGLFAFINLITEEFFEALTRNVFLWSFLRVVICGWIISLFTALKVIIHSSFKFEEDNDTQQE